MSPGPPKAFDPEGAVVRLRDVARSLVALTQGMAPLARISEPPAVQRPIVRAALDGLRAWARRRTREATLGVRGMQLTTRRKNRLLGLALGTAATLSPVRAQSAASVLVEGGRWFDVEAGAFVPNRGLLIQDGVFARLVTPSGEAPPQVPVIRLEDRHHILPGFVDVHAHYSVSLLEVRREEFHVMPVQYLANGVTLTFSAGEYDPDGMQRLRESLERGDQAGPHLITSGPYFGSARKDWHGDPERIPAEVEEWVARGVGGFKAKGIDAACLEVLIRSAHEHGLTVTGHLGSGFRGSVNPADAIDMGIDRVEHFLGGAAMPSDQHEYRSLGSITADTPGFAEIVAKFAQHGVFFTPTITAFGYFSSDSTGLYESWYDERSLLTDYVLKELEDPPMTAERRQIEASRDIFAGIHRAKLSTIDDYWRGGGQACVGTDLVCRGRYLPGFGYHRELAALAQSGIPPAEVLRMATIQGARALHLDDRYGSIAVGKSGDLVILSGDPTEDITRTRKIEIVVRSGIAHDPAELLESVRGRLGPTSEVERSEW